MPSGTKLAQSPSAKMDCSPLTSQSWVPTMSWPRAVQLQPAISSKVSEARMPAAQTFRSAGTCSSTFEQVPRGIGSHDSYACAHVHAQHSQLRMRPRWRSPLEMQSRMRGALSSRVRRSRRRMSSRAIAGSQIDHPAELGCQLNACGAAADDGDINVAALRQAAHDMGAQTGIERFGLILAVDEVAVFEDTGRGEVVGAAAEGQYQHVVIQLSSCPRPIRRPSQARCQTDPRGRMVDGLQLPGNVFEMMRARMRHVLHLLLVDVPGAGSEGMQHRFPDVDSSFGRSS